MRASSGQSSIGISILIAVGCLLFAGFSDTHSLPESRAEIGRLSLILVGVSIALGLVLRAIMQYGSEQLRLRDGWISNLLGASAIAVQIALCLAVIERFVTL